MVKRQPSVRDAQIGRRPKYLLVGRFKMCSVNVPFEFEKVLETMRGCSPMNSCLHLWGAAECMFLMVELCPVCKVLSIRAYCVPICSTAVHLSSEMHASSP